MSPIGEAAAMFTSLHKLVSQYFSLSVANSESPQVIKLSVQK